MRRIWLRILATGVVLATLGFVAVALQTFLPRTGWAFYPIVTSGVLVGGLLVLVSTLFLAERATWRGIVLIVWALIAVTSPWFGWLFLFPWAVLALTLPLIVVIVRAMFRAA